VAVEVDCKVGKEGGKKWIDCRSLCGCHWNSLSVGMFILCVEHQSGSARNLK
jgi:hypothetical protein